MKIKWGEELEAQITDEEREQMFIILERICLENLFLDIKENQAQC